MRLYWFCERSEYKNECTEYTFEKGYQGGHCIPGAESLCRPFQKLHGRKYSVLEKVDKGIEMKKFVPLIRCHRRVCLKKSYEKICLANHRNLWENLT